MNCPQCGALNETRDYICSNCGLSFATSMKFIHQDLSSPSPESIRRKQHNTKVLIAWFVSTCVIFSILYFFK